MKHKCLGFHPKKTQAFIELIDQLCLVVES